MGPKTNSDPDQAGTHTRHRGCRLFPPPYILEGRGRDPSLFHHQSNKGGQRRSHNRKVEHGEPQPQPHHTRPGHPRPTPRRAMLRPRHQLRRGRGGTRPILAIEDKKETLYTYLTTNPNAPPPSTGAEADRGEEERRTRRRAPVRCFSPPEYCSEEKAGKGLETPVGEYSS